MKVLLVAQDIAPSSAFELLAAELKCRGHEPTLLVGRGKVFPESLDEVRKRVRDSHVVIVGMSSSAKLAEPEIAACEEAVSGSKRFGFYGDTYHCHERARKDSWFGPYRDAADFFLAINDEEAKAARTVFTNPHLISVATANPIWEDYFFPKHTRAEVRAKYNVADNEVFILAPGWKLSASNIVVWELLIEAAREMDRKPRIMFSCHPGDRLLFAVDSEKIRKVIAEKFDQLAIKNVGGQANVSLTKVQQIVADALNNSAAGLNIYQDLRTFSSLSVEFLPGDVKTSDVLPGADVVVEWGSSLAIEAAHQRIPVISVSTEMGRRRVYTLSKTEKWEPVELGVAKEVHCNSMALYDQISMLTGNKALADVLRRRQAEVYPKPQKKGSAIKKMADTLESIVKKGRCCS